MTAFRLQRFPFAWILPIALLCRLALLNAGVTTSDHSVHLLRESGSRSQRAAGRRIWFLTHGRAWFSLGALVFVLAYFELVMSVTLAASRMTPMIVELYNQMHYGQRALLSASVLIALLVPAILFVLVMGLRRLIERAL